MMCTTVLHGGVCHRTSTPHKSGNTMKEKKKKSDPMQVLSDVNFTVKGSVFVSMLIRRCVCRRCRVISEASFTFVSIREFTVVWFYVNRACFSN